MKTQKKLILSLDSPGVPPVVHAKQEDGGTRVISAELIDDCRPYMIPPEAHAVFRFRKPSGKGGFYDALADGTPAVSASGSHVTVALAPQVLTEEGRVQAEINLLNAAGERLSSFAFVIQVEKSALPDAAILSSSYYNVLSEQIAAVLRAEEAAGESAAEAKAAAQASKASADRAEAAGLTPDEHAKVDNLPGDTVGELEKKLQIYNNNEKELDCNNFLKDGRYQCQGQVLNAPPGLYNTHFFVETYWHADVWVVQVAHSVNVVGMWKRHLLGGVWSAWEQVATVPWVSEQLEQIGKFIPLSDVSDTWVTHRNSFRGKNLGTAVTPAQKAAIQNGSFEDLWLGDYWVIGGHTWRIADFNYWLNCGDNAVPPNHLVIMPDKSLYSHVMNDTNITIGGYVGSKMYTEGLAQAKTLATSAFPGMVLSHRTCLVNAVTNGKPAAMAWYDSTLELPNEIMMYGCHIFTPQSDGVTIVTSYTVDNSQLALMAAHSRFIKTRESYRLRDVVSAADFAFVYYGGYPNYAGASTSHGVRPVFAIG